MSGPWAVCQPRAVSHSKAATSTSASVRVAMAFARDYVFTYPRRGTDIGPSALAT